MAQSQGAGWVGGQVRLPCSYPQQPLILPEPLLPPLIVRHDLFYLAPELLRVVMLLKMDEFVDDHIIQHWLRRHNQPPVEIQISLMRTTAGQLTEDYPTTIEAIKTGYQSVKRQIVDTGSDHTVNIVLVKE